MKILYIPKTIYTGTMIYSVISAYPLILENWYGKAQTLIRK